MNNKYNKGDIVVLKDKNELIRLSEVLEPYYITRKMTTYGGEEAVIAEVYNDDTTNYRLDIDNCKWIWPEEAFIGKKEIENE